MEPNVLQLPTKNSLISKLFAIAALVAWITGLVAHVDWGTRGITLMLMGGTIGWILFPMGPWAVFANFTLPTAAIQILRDKSPRKAVIATYALCFTSFFFWSALLSSSIEQGCAAMAAFFTALALLPVAYLTR